MQQLVYTPEELERIQMGLLALLCYAKRHDRRELPPVLSVLPHYSKKY